MAVAKPNRFIGFGAMEVTKPYEFIGFGAMEVTKPYEFIGFGASRSQVGQDRGAHVTRNTQACESDPVYPGPE